MIKDDNTDRCSINGREGSYQQRVKKMHVSFHLYRVLQLDELTVGHFDISIRGGYTSACPSGWGEDNTGKTYFQQMSSLAVGK